MGPNDIVLLLFNPYVFAVVIGFFAAVGQFFIDCFSCCCNRSRNRNVAPSKRFIGNKILDKDIEAVPLNTNTADEQDGNKDAETRHKQSAPNNLSDSDCDKDENSFNQQFHLLESFPRKGTTQDEKDGNKDVETKFLESESLKYTNANKEDKKNHEKKNETKDKKKGEKKDEKKDAEKNKKPPSLTNIGANCYLNSAFQGISSCDKFVQDINAIQESLSEMEKLKLFNKLISILNGNEGNRMELSRNEIFRNWNKPGQQDSFELLSYVMNQVYNEIRNKNEKYKNSIEEWLNVPLPLRLIVKNRIWCGCNTELETPLQSDLALHVPIPSDKNLDLQRLVDEFFKMEPIEDYSCDNSGCDGKTATRSTILCKPLPRTICIHLQRTYWNGYMMIKKKDKIDFSKTLIIKSKFCWQRSNTDTKERQKSLPSQEESKLVSFTTTNFHTDSSNLELEKVGKVKKIEKKEESDLSTSKSTTAEGIDEEIVENIDSKDASDPIASILNTTEELETVEKIESNEESDPSTSKSTQAEGIDEEIVENIDSKDASDPIASIFNTTEEVETGEKIESNEESDPSTSISAKAERKDEEAVENIESKEKSYFRCSNSSSAEKMSLKSYQNNETKEESNPYTLNSSTAEGEELETSQNMELSQESAPSDSNCMNEEETEIKAVHNSESGSELLDNDICSDESYQLTSVIVHFGSVYGGHYICYKRVGDRWFCTDDSHIREVKESEVFNCEAYILFYEKD